MKKKLMNYFSRITDKFFLIGILIYFLGQTISYYAIKLLEMNYHTINAPIDKLIPFVPQMVYFYLIWYPFLFLVLYYIYINDDKIFKKGIIIGTMSYLIADVIFLLYPTIVIRPDIMYDKLDALTGFLIKATYNGDNPPINCFPSIHCLFCFHTIFMFYMLKNTSWKKRTLVIIVSLLIISSTVLIKQHYFYDIVGSLILIIIMDMIGFLLLGRKKCQIK